MGNLRNCRIWVARMEPPLSCNEFLADKLSAVGALAAGLFEVSGG